ncbi:hypothetical protein SALWKB12_0635 [Snodgrassella communis]|nr:hypothetical protein SALWKB12_0635 [Snodgrassella communis]
MVVAINPRFKIFTVFDDFNHELLGIDVTISLPASSVT